MSNESRLLGIIKTAATEAVDANKPMEYAVGTVEAEPPGLAIRLDQKRLLTMEFLVLTRNVTDFETEISFDDPDILQQIAVWNDSISELLLAGKMKFEEKVNHKITMYNALKVGEKVILLRLQGGGGYLVLDRVVST